MNIYVKDIVREPKDTLYTFLSKVLRLKSTFNGYSTVNTTYFDPEFNKVQCTSGKHRSFDDLILISKTYFKVSDKAIAKVIKKFLDDDDDLSFVLCDSANKWVLNNGLTANEVIKYCARYNKSHLKTDCYGAGKYSFNDIITLMGLTKEDVKIND